jgi:hypothetical protein
VNLVLKNLLQQKIMAQTEDFAAEHVFEPMHLTLAKKNAHNAIICLRQAGLRTQKIGLKSIVLKIAI